MLEINNIEDLKPYVKYVPAKYNNGKTASIVFEIMQDGKLDDVTINCNIDLSFDFIDVFGVEVLYENDKDAVNYEIRFIAKDIYAKKNFVCEHVKCENLQFEEDVAFNCLLTNDKVKGKSISALDIKCSCLDADYVYSKVVNAIIFEAKTFYGKDILFTNVSFHQPDFPESLVNTWKGVKIDKNQFVIDYDYLPF